MPSRMMNIRISLQNLRNRIIPLLVFFALSAACAEVACRAFWSVRFGVPFFEPEHILYAFYPEIEAVDDQLPSHDDQYFDILLLDASVMHPGWGLVERQLKQLLWDRGFRNVRLYNLSELGHTSRDSLLKYSALDDARFDLIVYYHGLNESRANNVPPELFDKGYNHYSWYETTNNLSPYHSKAIFALPYSLHYLWLRVVQMLQSDEYVPTHAPRDEWVQYGHTIRTAQSLKENIDDLLEIASQRGDPVLLMTVALHVPQNYSLQLFNEHKLDYGSHELPLEIWGEPDHVIAAVELHNQIIREMAASRKGVLFLDMAVRMPKKGAFFNDPCHLTPRGSTVFAENIVDAISPLISQSPAALRK